MADIISICDKRDRAKLEREATLSRRKQRAVAHLFKRSCCAAACEKCGVPVAGACSGQGCGKMHEHRVPYQFCDDCTEEFIDYIERLKGRGDADCFWHNSEWLDLWQRWIEYQGALDRYMKSKEFVKLLNELKQTHPD